MVSKQVKLRLALTKAIVNFFSQEDLYCDELQIQGTVCITADKNAIFVTQITETITDPDHAVSEAIREDDIDGQITASQLSSSSVVIKEPLATSLKVKKPHSSVKPSFFKSKGSSDPNPPSAGFNHISSPSLSQVPLTSTDGHNPSGAFSNFHAFEPLSKFNYSDTIRNSLAVQEKLTADGKFSDLKNLGVGEDCYSDDSENSLEGCVIVQPSRQNKHASSSSSSGQQPSKKQKTDPNLGDEDDPKVANQAALNLTKKPSGVATSSSPRPTKTETWLTNRPLLSVNPILSPIFPGTPERQFALNPSIKQEKIDDMGGVDLRVATSPGTHGLGGDLASAAEFPWQLSSPPDGHASLTDWPANSWVRKPKTKFSPEQLRSLEDAYQSDPFLSTCAERRAELARKLNLTEKNIQIWFQNQRRRRRAAAYSRLHYSAPDSAGGNTVDPDQSSVNAEKDLEEEEIVEVREEDLDEEEEDERKNDEMNPTSSAANGRRERKTSEDAQNGIDERNESVNAMENAHGIQGSIRDNIQGNIQGSVQGSPDTVLSLLQSSNNNSPPRSSGLPTT